MNSSLCRWQVQKPVKQDCWQCDTEDLKQEAGLAPSSRSKERVVTRNVEQRLEIVVPTIQEEACRDLTS